MRRRRFLGLPLLAGLGAAPGVLRARGAEPPKDNASGRVKLFLCGDVMTGRGIDQVLPHPGNPQLHEPYLQSARQYVQLAERANGPIPRDRGFGYIWGDALRLLEQAAPDARIINLETAVTRSSDHWRGKGIHYRMHPANLPCLQMAAIDCCVLANNHVLDWGYAGLQETLASLRQAGIRSCGAGVNSEAAMRPAIIELGRRRRVLVFAMATGSSGTGRAWAAAAQRPGVWRLPGLDDDSVATVRAQVERARRPGDIVIASIHWGGNWGYAIPDAQRRFARALIDHAGVDLVHGHSSHHPRAMELYRGKLVLYGCGDFINDYEGIGGNEQYRGDLTVMYLPELDPADGRLVAMTLQVLQTRRLRLRLAGDDDRAWLADVLDRESRPFGAGIEQTAHGLRLEPNASASR